MINGVNVGYKQLQPLQHQPLAMVISCTVIMTSNDPCANPTTATSNAIPITTTSVTPSVSITSTTTSICSGGSVTFTATPTNGGSTPTYQWHDQWSECSRYKQLQPLQHQPLPMAISLSVIMTSNDPCANPTTATSNAIPITTTYCYSIGIDNIKHYFDMQPVAQLPLLPHQPMVDQLQLINGMINGVNVAGQTASTFTTSTLADGDIVSVMMTS